MVNEGSNKTRTIIKLKDYRSSDTTYRQSSSDNKGRQEIVNWKKNFQAYVGTGDPDQVVLLEYNPNLDFFDEFKVVVDNGDGTYQELEYTDDFTGNPLGFQYNITTWQIEFGDGAGNGYVPLSEQNIMITSIPLIDTFRDYTWEWTEEILVDTENVSSDVGVAIDVSEVDDYSIIVDTMDISTNDPSFDIKIKQSIKDGTSYTSDDNAVIVFPGFLKGLTSSPLPWNDTLALLDFIISCWDSDKVVGESVFVYVQTRKIFKQ